MVSVVHILSTHVTLGVDQAKVEKHFDLFCRVRVNVVQDCALGLAS